MRHGRIVRSGADPEALDRVASRIDRIVSDEDWWGAEWRRALRHPEPVAPVKAEKEHRRPARRTRIRWAERYRPHWIAKAERRRALLAWERDR